MKPRPQIYYLFQSIRDATRIICFVQSLESNISFLSSTYLLINIVVGYCAGKENFVMTDTRVLGLIYETIVLAII